MDAMSQETGRESLAVNILFELASAIGGKEGKSTIACTCR